MHSEKNNSKVVDPSWHEFRAKARRNAFSPEEFSPAERARYNLDSDDPVSPAGITGQDNPDTYTGESVGPGPSSDRDIRSQPWR